MITTKLRDATLELLTNRSVKLTLARINADTGLPETWLSMFGQGRIDDPSVNKVETLYEYLSGSTVLPVKQDAA
jgi:hypothetical protein